MINRCISDKWYRIRGNFFLVMIVSCAFASCVSVPKAAVGMSVQLEQQLYALQQATNSIVEKASILKSLNMSYELAVQKGGAIADVVLSLLGDERSQINVLAEMEVNILTIAEEYD